MGTKIAQKALFVKILQKEPFKAYENVFTAVAIGLATADKRAIFDIVELPRDLHKSRISVIFALLFAFVAVSGVEI